MTEVLTLHNNVDLTGAIPTEVGQLTQLMLLSLFGTGLSGPIPTELGRLLSLERLFLHFTGLTGTMPAEICALRALNLVQLSANCAGANPAVICPQPSCCTVCF